MTAQARLGDMLRWCVTMHDGHRYWTWAPSAEAAKAKVQAGRFNTHGRAKAVRPAKPIGLD